MLSVSLRTILNPRTHLHEVQMFKLLVRLCATRCCFVDAFSLFFLQTYVISLLAPAYFKDVSICDIGNHKSVTIYCHGTFQCNLRAITHYSVVMFSSDAIQARGNDCLHWIMLFLLLFRCWRLLVLCIKVFGSTKLHPKTNIFSTISVVRFRENFMK